MDGMGEGSLLTTKTEAICLFTYIHYFLTPLKIPYIYVTHFDHFYPIPFTLPLHSSVDSFLPSPLHSRMFCFYYYYL